MSYQIRTSPIYKFDESEFIRRFISDYYTETDFDLNSSFSEYYMNFIQSNSADYNSYIFIELYIHEYVNHRNRNLSFDNFLYEKLYLIIKDALKI